MRQCQTGQESVRPQLADRQKSEFIGGSGRSGLAITEGGVQDCDGVSVFLLYTIIRGCALSEFAI